MYFRQAIIMDERSEIRPITTEENVGNNTTDEGTDDYYNAIYDK